MSSSQSEQDIAIKLEGVGKSFRIYEKPHHRLMQGLLRGKKQYFREFKALDDVSFEMNKGETVGIIGRNGAGKSTLLQIICGTMAQTTGKVSVNGRIAALLELGAGFKPEFTGRENIYMYSSVLGLTRSDIENRFDDIAAFADIGEFLEQPVKTYSSGMFVRLAFAVNIMTDPEVMIVDEALAVGDINFRTKCMTALTRIQQGGATVLFVSHDINSVKSLCSRGIYLEKGRVRVIGKAGDVAEQYIREMREEMNKDVAKEQETTKGISEDVAKRSSEFMGDVSVDVDAFKTSTAFDDRVAPFRYGKGGVRIAYAEMVDGDGNAVLEADFDQDVCIRIYIESSRDILLGPSYYIMDEKKNLILGAGPRQLDMPYLDVKHDTRYIVTFKTPLPLQEGNYSVQIQLNRPLIEGQSAEYLDVIDDAIVFKVASKKPARIWTKVYIDNEMEVIKA